MADSWSFVHINDMQPGSPRSFRYRAAWGENAIQAYAQVRELKPELVLVGGDLTRDGSVHDYEFDEAKAQLDSLGAPYHVIPGNMDTGNKHTDRNGSTGRDDIALNMTGQSLDRFAQWFGEFPWTITHRDVRFTGFYAAVAGSGLPQEQRFWDFMEALPSQPRAQHHVVMMHYALFVDRMDEPNFDMTDPKQYTDWYFCIDHPHRDRIFDLLKRSGATMVPSGHIHCRRPVQVVDGVRFYKTASTTFGQYANRWPDGDTTLGFYRFNVSETGIEPTFIPLAKVSTNTEGYGKGGHVLPADRDYSLAWEK